MRGFNRAVATLLMLAIFAAALITLLVSVGASDPAQYGIFSQALQRSADAGGAEAAITVAASIIVALLMLVLLRFELAPKSQGAALMVSSGNDGVTTVDEGSVRMLSEKVALTVRGLRSVRCSVRERQGGLSISCFAAVALGSNIPETSSQVQVKVKEAVEKLTGLQVVNVNVKAHYERTEAKLAVE